MMIKKFIAILCLTQLVSSVPYQYPGYTTMSSTPAYLLKQSINSNSPAKFNVGYKIQETGKTKVKKEFSNSEYQNIFAADSLKRPYSSNEFTSFDDGYSTTASPLPQYPFPEQLKIAYIPNIYPTKPPQPPQYPPAIVSNKILHPIHHDKHHLMHDLVAHYITNVAAHKLKHVGETLESGVLNEPIIHKLSLAKAALLQLLAIIGPLSAIKSIHFVAKASDPHSDEPAEHVENNYIAPVPAPIPLPAEIVEYGPPHYPPTLVGMILHFVAQLSKFNTEAKLHLIPNLLKVISRSSASSVHTSGHIPE